ncbi:zinc carboxypeptidase-like [Culicoides brevitarsis]|uniref:zinc carboxypeptidase-like n=1 Tax=Culicoides brevitarsis TaxID=469753 RepID=UPI00307BBD4D
MFKLLAILLLATFVATEKARFDHYKVFRVQAKNENDLKLLRDVEDGNSFMFWDSAKNIGDFADIVVPPHKFDEIESLISRFGLKAKVMVNNLQDMVDSERIGKRDEPFGWEAYYPLETIYEWVANLSRKYPDVVSTFEIGKSYENRPILGVKISYKEGNKGIFIESNIHAREWITSATVTYLMNELLTSTDPAVRDLAENVDWYIIPVFNVDGFVYSHTSDRMWRKTRQPTSSLCYGTDANRNFDFYWFQGGASNNPCSETYAGPNAFSEPETRALGAYFDSVSKNVSAFFSFHSYGQYFLYPFGSKQAPAINNEAEHIAVGEATVKRLAERYGTKYRMGNTITTLYESSGITMDWIKGVYEIPFAFTYEFRDTGNYGFMLPADQIIPNGEEVLDSIVAFVEKCRELGYFPKN